MKPTSPKPMSPSRFITSYTAGQALRTADQTITRNLDETYKIKDNMTEQSVIEFFNDMLESYDDVADGNKTQPKSHVSKPYQPIDKKAKGNSSEKAAEFYFEKSSDPTRQQKIQQITVTDSHVLKQQQQQQRAKQQQQQQQKPTENLYVDSPVLKPMRSGLISSQSPINPRSSNNTDSTKKKNTEHSTKPRNEYTIELFKTTAAPTKGHDVKRTDSLVKSSEIKPNQKNGTVITLENNATIEKISSNMAYKPVKGFDSFMMY